MAKTIRIISAMLILITLMTTVCYADPPSAGGAYSPESIKASTTIETTNMMNAAKLIMQYIRTFGVIVSVSVLMIIGVKYILGSVDEKAEYKKSMMPFLIGTVIIFISTQIVGFIYNTLNP